MEIYTDASICGNKFGIGILFIYDNDVEKTHSSSLRILDIRNELFGNIGRLTTKKISNDPNIGEGLAILRSLQMLSYKIEDVTLYTDSLTFFELLYNFRKTKNEILSIIVKRCKILIKKKNIDIRWIKAHVGVYGNEIADKLSKEGRKNLCESLFLEKIIRKIEKGTQLKCGEQQFYNRKQRINRLEKLKQLEIN